MWNCFYPQALPTKNSGQITYNILHKEEVSEVLKVYVNKTNTVMDVDNLRWDCVDIFLNSNGGSKKWKESKFRKNIFS